MQRNTKQREAIWQVIAEAGRPLSVAEILAQAGAHLDTLGISTVYRTVNALLEQKKIQEVVIPGFADRYEINGLPHHHHFHCHRCDQVFDMKGCVNTVTRLAPEGYQVDEHHILLSGTCPACREKST